MIEIYIHAHIEGIKTTMERLTDGKKKRGAIYRLIDEYSMFYHRFILPNRKYTAGMWQQLAANQSYKIWAGYAFESLCHKHIDTIKKALGISMVYTEISSLFFQGTTEKEGFQVDLIIDRKDDSINLCEIKFHNAPFSIDKKYYQELLKKREQFIAYVGTMKQVFLTFITNHTLVNNTYASEIVDARLQLEDLLV